MKMSSQPLNPLKRWAFDFCETFRNSYSASSFLEMCNLSLDTNEKKDHKSKSDKSKSSQGNPSKPLFIEAVAAQPAARASFCFFDSSIQFTLNKRQSFA